ncbi:peptidoglycan-binding protein [Streptomyces spinoverrucosus]|uniref:Peptidoglycan-binding protein n=1 Tax=Streptomyces spinoverrucosus TaxID=284043 RepID=A0A4Y3VS79_9ACTN|nr:peptidoglycan-binding protein [Streptomyces spinoverrucosus]GEC09814.1 peptidoglycan-binding protein [Streptomyces spinoverrucosus]GHB96936.1 peptidoglycan-binding protein [Streptomyces spinoverrucosus]
MALDEDSTTDREERWDMPAARGRRRSRWRGRAALQFTVAVLCTAAVTGGVICINAQEEPTHTGQDAAVPPATAPVVKGDLVSQVRGFGTLDYTGRRSLSASLSGTLTWLPPANTTVARGEKLYAVDDKPVLLMYGSTPTWRAFAPGMPGGRDVRMLEENLAALGYGGFTVDDKFTDLTEAAVKRWQKDVGLPVTGRIELGRVAVAPGKVRIAGTGAAVGDTLAPGAKLLTVTAIGHQVSVDVPVSDQKLAVKGTEVTVELPDGTRTPGTVSQVSPPREEEGKQPVVPVVVKLKRPKDTDGLQRTDVDVWLRKSEAKNVLSVPVTALKALPGGGFGVQVVADEAVTTVKVTTGAFADGRVAISGSGIAEGVKVGVPKL